MFAINEEDNSIYITRGDVAFFSVSSETDDGEAFKFHPGDVVRFKVFGKKNCENVVLSKDFGIEEETEEALIYLEEKDTKIGDVISKPVDYWYEVELNPYTDPQTIIGYDDEDGAKIFKLFPEGAEAEDDVLVTPEDIPVVDEELDLTSTRPVQNQAISRAIASIKSDVKAELKTHSEKMATEVEKVSELFKEEITNDFIEEVNSGFTIVPEFTRIFKQGNVISGYVCLSGNFDAVSEPIDMFKYNAKYMAAQLYNLANIVLMNDGDIVETKPCIMGASYCKYTSSVPATGIVITFCYIA